MYHNWTKSFKLASNSWVSLLQKSEFAAQILRFEKLGLGLDNCGRTTKNAYCPIYSLCHSLWLRPAQTAIPVTSRITFYFCSMSFFSAYQMYEVRRSFLLWGPWLSKGIFSHTRTLYLYSSRRGWSCQQGRKQRRSSGNSRVGQSQGRTSS